jgi:hypothetical protein
MSPYQFLFVLRVKGGRRSLEMTTSKSNCLVLKSAISRGLGTIEMLACQMWHLYGRLTVRILPTSSSTIQKLIRAETPVHVTILWRVGWYTSLIRRVLVRMIGFISSWFTHLHTAVQRYHLFTHFPVLRCTCTETSLSPLVVSHQRLSTQKLPQSHTSNVTHQVFNSHDPLFSNYELSTVVSHLELTDNCSRTSFTLSYKPLIWHAGLRFDCCVTANAVTRPFPTLASSKCL